jgi:ferritin-like metal-binding protein YciE
MFEHLDTPDDLFTFRLGTALSAEHDSLSMLQELAGAVRRDDLREMFNHHAEETREQIANLEQCFSILGKPVDNSPSPTTKGLAKEASSLLRKTDASLVDQVALSGGLETEHYEIASYTTLIDMADARGLTAVCDLLRSNLAQEQEASEKLARAVHELTHAAA